MSFTSGVINFFRIQAGVPANTIASSSSGLSEAQSILSSIGASNGRSARSDFKAMIQEVPEKLKNSPSYYRRFFRGSLEGAPTHLRNDPNFYYSLIREAPPGASLQSYLELIEMAPEELRNDPAFYLPIILRVPKHDVQGYRTFCRELIQKVPESVRNHPDLYFYLIREASAFNQKHPSFYDHLFREAPETFRSNPELLVASLQAAPKTLRRNGDVYAWMAYIAPEPLQYEIGFYCKLARAVPEKLRDNRLFYLQMIRAAPAELQKNLMFYVHLIKAAPEDLSMHYLLIREAPKTVQHHFWLYCTMTQLASENQEHLISELDELLLDGMSFDQAMQAVRKEQEKQELIVNAIGYLESQLTLVRDDRKKVIDQIKPEHPAWVNSKLKRRKEQIDVINGHVRNAVQYVEDHNIQYDSKDDRAICALYEQVLEHIRSLKESENKTCFQFKPIHILENKMEETVESRLKSNKVSIDRKLRDCLRKF